MRDRQLRQTNGRGKGRQGEETEGGAEKCHKEPERLRLGETERRRQKRDREEGEKEEESETSRVYRDQ